MFSFVLAFLYVNSAVSQIADWTWNDTTALDAYVARADPAYTYSLLSTQRYDAITDGVEDCTVHILNMTSLKWQNDTITSQSVWWHHLSIVIPDNVRIWDKSFMFIGGGSQRNAPPDPETDVFLDAVAEVAVRLGSAGAFLKQIPNQPMYLYQSAEPERRRSEDALIAWTWRHYIETNRSDPEMILQFPMVKAAKMAFDTIHSYTRQNVSSQFNIDKFFPAGGSKRGWITWLLGCVDRRVMAMSPMVLSILNLVETLGHHYRAYGGWSFAFNDYWSENITQHLYHPTTQALANLIDPFSYRQRMTMPKIVVQATADEFFRPDEPNFWFDQLIGPKYVKLMRNAQHALVGSYDNIIDSIVAMFRSMDENQPLPQFRWELTQGVSTGRTTVYTTTPPAEVRAWFARSADGEFGHQRRDFRWFIRSIEEPEEVDLNLVVWEDASADVVTVTEDEEYYVEFDRPAEGWLGFFIEVDFILNDSEASVFEGTTELNVVPNTWPFPFCSNPLECTGSLV
ncbi:unnamed protein product [Owenia fusiformis]|uniref:Uncharacterized protein n=1 Tax=Owenia fusiformis TaxID=6347 RepID=A0A8J1XP51_OWEFU|nr:unnamed protein product [Owenia fusiformis]